MNEEELKREIQIKKGDIKRTKLIISGNQLKLMELERELRELEC